MCVAHFLSQRGQRREGERERERSSEEHQGIVILRRLHVMAWANFPKDSGKVRQAMVRWKSATSPATCELSIPSFDKLENLNIFRFF